MASAAEAENYDTASDSSPQASEQEKTLALTAQSEFDKSNYAASLQSLSKLEQSRPQDPKVAHNKAIVRCFKSGLTDITSLRKSLKQIAKQMQCDLDDPDTLADVDQCYVFYNEAVTLYYLRQFPTCLQVLIKIFSLIEQLDENLGRQVCFLLAEVYLRLNFPGRTLAVVHFMETSLLSHGAKLKSTLPLEKERGDNKDKDSDKDKEDNGKTGFAEESPLPKGIRVRLLRLKIRAFVALGRGADASAELETLLEVDAEHPVTRSLASHVAFLGGNLASASETISPLLNSNDDGSFKDRGESEAVANLNNAGCVYQAMGKHHLACLHFQKALNKNCQLLDEFAKPASGDALANRPLLTIGSNYKYELLYNMGVSLLCARKPVDAFDCLVEAIQLHYRDPLIWLRLAECCILVHKPENQKDFRLSERRRDIVRSSVGQGPHKKIVLSARISDDNCPSLENAAMPVPTLEFAALALRNADLLLARLTVTDPQEGGAKVEEADLKGKPELNVTLSQVNTISRMRKPQHYAFMRNSILADSSYVALCLGDYLGSLHHAEQLLMQPQLSGNHKLLGHLYAAESLVLMNRLNEAIAHLHPDNVAQLSNLPAPESDQKTVAGFEWYPATTQTAKVVLQYNLSAVYALRGELEKAGELLRQLWTAKSLGIDVPIQVVTLALYVELQLGRTDVARTIIKQHCPQYR